MRIINCCIDNVCHIILILCVNISIYEFNSIDHPLPNKMGFVTVTVERFFHFSDVYV